MSTLRLEIVTAEKLVYSADVNMVLAPGTEGQLGILPHHAPLMTTLIAGELIIKKDGEEECLAITGGFLEVRPDKVIILADAAERAEEIDAARAEAAKCRALERLEKKEPTIDTARVEASLRRALARLKAVEHRRRRERAGPRT